MRRCGKLKISWKRRTQGYDVLLKC